MERLRRGSDRDELTADPIIVRRGNARPFLIHVIPIDGAVRGPFLGARVLLILNDLEKKVQPSANELMRIFRLTAAEARLAALISTGMSLEAATEQLGIARETARTQLKAIFAKTGVHRQSELVALTSKLFHSESTDLDE